MATTISSVRFPVPFKRQFLFFSIILHIAFLSASLFGRPANLMAHGFVESMIGALRTRRGRHSALIQYHVFRNDNQEHFEDEENIGNGKDNDDLVQAPQIVPQQEISLPRQISYDVLTSFEEKERREKERILLAEIQEGDIALKELRNLWGSQSGDAREEELLYQAARGIGNPQLWDESRSILEQLTKNNPTFLEPFARLSKLYCLMGRMEDSQTMALEVLKLKPWHILAIETMVATSYALNQIESSVYWASQRMPPPNQSTKRKEWIHRAIESSLEFEKTLKSQQDVDQKSQRGHSDGDDMYSFCVEEDAWQ
eukprot:CAMPEP_0116128278 /NCGR_PEP_ID=MMETSP0329-20121206/7276_1 /TAXON_ID=697910 /ORGANISM="Pseudo-nitzschia arenysensis, Strain B593" /LENGTH=312 /DNA_ID=CAMNT_0003622409 /DNA_START=72 /DNA_END=1010 /DNA_ORIENTATION=+